VTGRVMGPDGMPVVGATVIATDSQHKNAPLSGTTTDIEGRYSISIPAAASTLTVQFIGYETQTATIGGGRSVYDFSLKDSSVMMEEVVAIGYAKVKRKDVTGSTVSVSGQELASVPVMTAAQALQGKAAGVNIISTSGAPGAESQISIRGGASITGSTKPLYIVDGFEMSDALETVDINDIETIDVLKDASATAIYGSRGSNGIILITTKSAQKGKTQVSYNTYFSFDTLANSIDMVSNVEDYVKYQYELMALNNKRPSYAAVFDDGLASDAAGFGAGVYARIAERYGNARAIDWQERVFGGYALTQSHNVNIMTGTDKTQVMLSYNYNGQEGLSITQGAYKNTIRAKVQSELYKGVRLDLNTSFTNKKVEGAGLGLRNVLMSPLNGGTMFTEDHLLNQQTLLDYRAYDDAFGALNPIVQSLANQSLKRSRLFNVNAGLEFDFLKYFTWRTAGSYSWSSSKNTSFSDKNSTDYLTDPENTGIKGSISNSESYSYQITNTLSYNQTFNEKHKLGILLGQETRYSESEGNSLSLKKFPDPNFGLDDISNAEVSEKKTSHSRSGMVSLFARANYSFDDRYLLTATVRGDGSSKFMTGHKWGVFPAVSAAWRISEEHFWKDHKVADVINGLKFRVGYGTTGNNSIDSYSYSTSLQPASYPVLDNENNPVFLPETTLGNPNLRWETVITANVGLELSMFNNRVNITAEWYNNQSNDLLLKCKIPNGSGYNQQYRNVGKMRNRGWEVTLNTVNIQKKNFRWTSDLNLTFNRSKVISLNDDQTEMTFSQGGSRSGTVTYYATVGQRLGDMYGYKYEGIYTTDDFIEMADGSLIVRDGVVRPATGSV
ncbi:MAG: SusC/RagA family TonB-linked outer membrane protein, partial [Alistipes sp.]|nr:SusC/RagA family TonB-linked outer membrane protein [Alistipes sp.]